MSRYLKNLLAKSVQQAADIRPRLGSRFEEASTAVFSDSETIDGSLFQEQRSGRQPRRAGEQQDRQQRLEKVSVEPNTSAAAEHVQKDAGETRMMDGGKAAPISRENRNPFDLQVEGDDPGPASRARTRLTGREELEKSSSPVRPLLHGNEAEAAGSTVQVVTKTTVLQQGVRPAPALPSSPGRARTERQTGSDQPASKQNMVDRSGRNAGDDNRAAPRIRPESVEKTDGLLQRVEQAARLLRPDIPGEHRNTKKPPSVQVTIGRIEIRAVREKKQQPRSISRQAAPQRPALSLDEYLSKRSERGR